LRQRIFRLLTCFAAVAIVTFVALRVIRGNATTVGFAYLLLVLVIASTWGFYEAALSSIAATLAFNFFFFPPFGTFSVADPQNWMALFSFLATSLIASRLSAIAKHRAADALDRQRDLERLYTFSRAILLTSRDEPFANQLIRKLAETFGLAAAVLYDRRTGQLYHAGPADFEGLDDQLRDAALHGTTFSNGSARRLITAVRLGAEPIGSLALEGISLPDSVLQSVANLVAIGLEQAKAQELAHQIEAARESEQLRTTLIDAMAHEFKTPLTLIKGATTSVLSGEDELAESTREQLTIADEEAEHLRELIDNAIEMARLDTAHIELHQEPSRIGDIIREAVSSMQTAIENRPVQVSGGETLPVIWLDRRLIKLALKQLLDNALKYSPPELPVAIHASANGDVVSIDVTNHGAGITPEDKQRIFERFYRGQSVKNQIPGSGLGLNIARSIALAHRGDLTLTSQPNETTFRMMLPIDKGGPKN
jgi:two-component system sensor histidine kinase KdpD